MTVILYLIGKPGTGKYTIASEIAKDGYIISDNQLNNNPIFALLKYDGLTQIPEFAWDSISGIRNSVFDFLCNEPNNNYVLTNVLLDSEGDYRLFDQVLEVARKRNSIFVPVKLLISKEENVRRIQNEDRLLKYKSIDVNDAYSDQSLINIEHPNLLTLDVTELNAQDAARAILLHVKTIQNNE